MDVGVTLFATAETIRPDRLARAVEDRGFDSLWLGEHTHIPAGRQTDWPMADGKPLPQHYARMFDPFVALTAAASVTDRLRIATGVCLVNQHHPLTLAKTVASLDVVSGGRLLFGVGSGWNVEEMRDHGVDPSRRGSRMREHVAAMRALWTEDEASFAGEWVTFEASWSWPKPEPGHPPVLVGGGKGVLAHVIEWADGWIPIEGPMPVDRLLTRMRQMAADVGRDPASIAVHVTYATGTPEALDRYRDLGVDGIVLAVDPGSEGDVLRQLDALAPLASRNTA